MNSEQSTLMGLLGVLHSMYQYFSNRPYAAAPSIRLPQHDHATFSSALKDCRPKFGPTGEGSNEAAVYLSSLVRLVAVVRKAERSMTEEEISVEEYRALVAEADELISQLCWEQYYHNLVEQVEPFARPPEKQDCLQTKTYELAVGQGIIPKLIGNLIRELIGSQILGNGVQTILEALFLPPSWSSTPRPDKASTLLSRFTSEYKTGKIMQAIDTADFDTSAENLLVAVVQARAGVDCHRLTYMVPSGLAVSGDRLFIATTPVDRGNSPRLHLCQLSRSVEQLETSGSHLSNPPNVATRERQKLYEAEDADQNWKPVDFGTQFFGRLQAHSNKVWADGGRRIRAYDLETGDLVHVLNSSGKFSAFDDRIIRSKSKGEFACWRLGDLVDLRVQVSKAVSNGGQQAHSTLKVTGLTRPLQELEQLHGTSKWVCTESPSDGRNPSSLAVRLFDIEKPSSGASIVGLGLGQPVTRLVTHQDIPHFVVAAGNDSNVRIFDYRSTSPFPQLTIQGHTHDLQACAVAGFGGHFPVIFTGGKDELVKAWDIRHTKICMYELSTGCLQVRDLVWHPDRNTLFVAGQKDHTTKFGDDLGYMALENSKYAEADQWPKTAKVGPDYFGTRWCCTAHGILEYSFTTQASASHLPDFVEPPYYPAGGMYQYGW